MRYSSLVETGMSYGNAAPAYTHYDPAKLRLVYRRKDEALSENVRPMNPMEQAFNTAPT